MRELPRASGGPCFYSVDEVATMLGVTVAAVWRAVMRGELRREPSGAWTLISAAAIDAYRAGR